MKNAPSRLLCAVLISAVPALSLAMNNKKQAPAAAPPALIAGGAAAGVSAVIHRK